MFSVVAGVFSYNCSRLRTNAPHAHTRVHAQSTHTQHTHTNDTHDIGSYTHDTHDTHDTRHTHSHTNTHARAHFVRSECVFSLYKPHVAAYSYPPGLVHALVADWRDDLTGCGICLVSVCVAFVCAMSRVCMWAVDACRVCVSCMFVGVSQTDCLCAVVSVGVCACDPTHAGGPLVVYLATHARRRRTLAFILPSLSA